jgi:hypothetical protein
VRGSSLMRVLFVLTLVLIAGGLTYAFVIAALGQ